MHILLLLLVVLTNLSYGNWIKQTPPSNVKFNAVYMSETTDLAYIVGDSGIMYLSENAGATWTQKSSNLITGNINSTLFTTSNLAYVVTSEGSVFRSIDKAQSFSKLFTSNNNESINDISVSPSNIDYTHIVGDNGLYRNSTNGGSSWSSYTFTSEKLNSVSLKDLHFGNIVGNNGSVFYTTNGGNNWTSKTITGITENLNSVDYTGANDVFVAVGDNGKIARTTNKGQSWSVITSNTNTNLKSVYFTTNSNIGYIVGDGGLILRTSDAGLNWTSQVNNDNANLSAVAFRNNAIGLAVGDNGTILRTVSGGQNQSITLNYPLGNETWSIGEQVKIRWSQNSLTNVKIEITKDNKNSWSQIAVVDANLGEYSFTVSNPISEDVFIRVSDNDNPALKMESGKLRITNFTLTLTSPTLNQELNINSNHLIKWTSTNINQVDILFSSNNGVNWTLVGDNVSAANGQFSWAIGNTPTNQGKIKIENSDDANQFVVSQQFSILGASLFLNNPNGGSFDAGDVVNIQWQYQNLDKINIDYTTNGGVSWAGIANNFNASIGAYSWVVPYKPGQAQIRVMSSSDNTLFDISENSFNINGYSLTILNPLGGSYSAGSNVNIQWNADARINNIKLEYSSNGGSNWTVINNSVLASTGAYLWTTPNTAGANYKIRLTDDTGQIIKISNTFALSSLRFTYPLTNSKLTANTEYILTWEAIGFSSVNLSYSTNNGNSWVTIANSVLAPQNQINWTTPNINQAVLLKVEDSNDATRNHIINLTLEKAAITVNAPTTNLFHRANETVNINWTSNLVEFVNITYSVNNGADMPIANNVIASQGSFTWTAPNIESSQVKIKIQDATNNLVFGESGYFGISDDTMTLLSPNGNEIWNQGETREIKWTASDATLVNIELSNDNGLTWQTIATDVDGQMPYQWTIGKTPGAKSLIRVSDSQKPGIYDRSDMSFVINGIDLLSPNGNETYLLSTTEQITWKAVGTSKLNIYYSKNNGTTWNEIVKNFPSASGFYNWNIPAMTGNQFKIRILDPSKTNFLDISDNTFNINGIKITSPKENDKLLFGTNHKITFDKYTIQNIKIEHSTDNGATWYTVIAHQNGTSGEYNWNVPEMPGTQNKLKITSIEVPTLFDITNGTFEIMEQGVAITYPNGGENVAANASQTITWASANIDSVKIEYSADNGTSWNIITNATKASNKFYAWNTPNINGTKYLIRITDTKIADISDVSNANFNITGGEYLLPDEWNFVTGTGKTSHIIVPSNINPQVGNITIEVGDVIGIFHKDNGIMKSAGYGTWTGQDIAITAWGNNSLTTVKDGFDSSEEYNIRVWDKSTGIEYDVTVRYTSGNSYFLDNGISIVSSFETQRPLNINLTGGTWQLISSNLIPVDPTLPNIFKDVKDNIEYLKNEQGHLYYPKQGINQIGNWQVKNGYQIYSNKNTTLSIIGNTLMPANYSYTFNANFWYIISYLPSESRTIASVFSNLNNVILVKNTAGEIYYPAFGINQIGTMNPGEGYQVAVSQNSQTFSYTNNPPIAPAIPGIEMAEDEDPTYYQSEISKTGNSAVVIFNNSESWEGEFGIFDSYDRLVGNGKINDTYNSITIWGDNPITFDKDGARENEKLRIEFYDYKTKSVRKVEIEQIFELITSQDQGKDLVYKKDAIFNVEATKVYSTITDNLLRTSIYPNPTQETIYLNIDGEGKYTIEVIDLNGSIKINREINVVGKSTIKLDVNNLNTGSYIINIVGNRSISTQKFIKIE